MKELEVIRLFASGMTPSAIADELGISKRHVRRRMESIQEKMDSHGRLEPTRLDLAPLTPPEMNHPHLTEMTKMALLAHLRANHGDKQRASESMMDLRELHDSLHRHPSSFLH
jgi:ATP/maltotriose-dependent transcriptional regulator MalT